MSLRDQLKPFFGRRCHLTIDAELRTHFEKGVWNVFVFDTKALSEDTREQLHELIGQDDYDCFAIATDSESTDVQELLDEGVDEVLFYASDDQSRVFCAEGGDMDIFTSEVPVLLRNLRLRED